MAGGPRGSFLSAGCGGYSHRSLRRETGRPDDGQAGARSRGRLLLEVGITLVAVRWMLRLPARWAIGVAGGGLFVRWLVGVLVAAVLLVLAGDLARWLLPGNGGPDAPDRARRRRVLQPWLVFLGFLVLFGSPHVLPLAMSVSRRLQGLEVATWPLIARFVPWVGGLTLILAAGPLSRLLSFGPLLGRRKEPNG